MSQIKTNKEPVSKTSGIAISAEAFIPLFFQEYAFQIQDIYTNFNTIHNWKFCKKDFIQSCQRHIYK